MYFVGSEVKISNNASKISRYIKKMDLKGYNNWHQYLGLGLVGGVGLRGKLKTFIRRDFINRIVLLVDL
jgi:hypothetical protein